MGTNVNCCNPLCLQPEMLTQRAIFALTQGHAESAIPDACHTSSGLQLFQDGIWKETV